MSGHETHAPGQKCPDQDQPSDEKLKFVRTAQTEFSGPARGKRLIINVPAPDFCPNPHRHRGNLG